MKAIIISMMPALLLFCAACSVGPEQTAIALDDVVKLSVGKDTIPADGVSSRLISVTTGDKVDPNASVTFETDWGHWGGTTESKADVKTTGRNAAIVLVGETEDRAEVRIIATVEGYADTLTLVVTPSGPQHMRAALESGAIDADMQSSTTLNIALIPASGHPLSKALPVEFYSIPNTGADVVFSPVPVAYAADGVATVKVRSRSRTKGTVMVYALYRSGDSSSVASDTVSLELQ